MPALNRPFHAWDQNDPALGRVRSQTPKIELPFVEGDGKRAIPERHGSIDQLDTGMRDSIDRVVSGMGVELDFQHRPIDLRSSPRLALDRPSIGLNG